MMNQHLTAIISSKNWENLSGIRTATVGCRDNCEQYARIMYRKCTPDSRDILTLISEDVQSFDSISESPTG